jgi:hypothetical protein
VLNHLVATQEYDVIVISAGAHSDDAAVNYHVNLYAQLRILRSIWKLNTVATVVVIGSRAARLCSNAVGSWNPTANSYGHAKWLVTGLVQFLAARSTTTRYLVWAPPKMPTNVRSPIHTATELDPKVLDHAAVLVGALESLDTIPRKHCVWEYGRPIDWRADTGAVLLWLRRNYTVNGMHLLQFLTTRNFVGNTRLSDIAFPTTRSDVITRVYDQGARVVGSLHSYNPSVFLGRSHLCLVDLETELTLDGTTLTVGAGRSINQTLMYLESRGRTLLGVGSHGSQSLVAACVTGTHGHGKVHATMGDAIVAMLVSSPEAREPHWVTRHLPYLRVLSADHRTIVWAVRIATMELSPACIETVVSRTVDVEELLLNDHAKVVPLFGLRLYLITTVNQIGGSIEASQPSLTPHVQFRGGAMSFVVGTIVRPFVKAYLKVNPTSSTVQGTMTAAVRHHGKTSEFQLWASAEMSTRQPDWLNRELAVDSSCFEAVEVALSRLGPKSLYWYYRLAGPSTTVRALNFGRPTVFVDLHSPNIDLLTTATEVVTAACGALVVRQHMAKV